MSGRFYLQAAIGARRDFLRRCVALSVGGLGLGCGSTRSGSGVTPDTDSESDSDSGMESTSGDSAPSSSSGSTDTDPDCIPAAVQAYFEGALADATVLGHAYLDAFAVTDADLREVVELVMAAPNDAEAIEAIASAVTADFAELRLQTLAGWTCSLTELRLCAAVTRVC
jgi:hypothetical protein